MVYRPGRLAAAQRLEYLQDENRRPVSLPSYRHRNRRRRHDHDHDVRHGPAAVTPYVPPVTPPTPQPTTYTVTLPALVGASTTPAAGAHTVTEGDGFSFILTLDADYDQSVPVVTVNGNALIPDANGKYTITDISANLTVAITGIVRNTTTGIEQVENATLIRAESGALLIRTPVSVTAQVIALTGNVVRTVRLPAGDSRVDGLASDIYIVRLSNEITKKVIIR